MSRKGQPQAGRTNIWLRCRWPHCRYRAVTEIKRGPMPFVELCGAHRPLWDLLDDTQLRQMEWAPRRRLGRS